MFLLITPLRNNWNIFLLRTRRNRIPSTPQEEPVRLFPQESYSEPIDKRQWTL